jgi:hypothetical protein
MTRLAEERQQLRGQPLKLPKETQIAKVILTKLVTMVGRNVECRASAFTKTKSTDKRSRKV